MWQSIYKIGNMFVFCHRRRERTIQIRGHYLPVCARCTGIYIGMFAFFLLQLFIEFSYRLEIFFISILLMLPTTFDGTTQLLKIRESTNVIRLITGFICGIGCLMLLLASLDLVQEVF